MEPGQQSVFKALGEVGSGGQPGYIPILMIKQKVSWQQEQIQTKQLYAYIALYADKQPLNLHVTYRTKLNDIKSHRERIKTLNAAQLLHPAATVSSVSNHPIVGKKEQKEEVQVGAEEKKEEEIPPSFHFAPSIVPKTKVSPQQYIQQMPCGDATTVSNF